MTDLHSKPEPLTLRLEPRQLIGFLIAGAFIGVVILGILATLFDAARDRLNLTWSLEFFTLLVGFFAADIALTMSACWGFLHLFVLVAERSEKPATETREPHKVSFLSEPPVNHRLSSNSAEPVTQSVRSTETAPVRNPYH